MLDLNLYLDIITSMAWIKISIHTELSYMLIINIVVMYVTLNFLKPKAILDYYNISSLLLKVTLLYQQRVPLEFFRLFINSVNVK